MDGTYDLVVIGSGPAGEKAATHAAYFGYRVAVVEREPWLGGVVVRNAGVPTKTLRETALYITGFQKRELYGVSASLDRFEALHVLRRRAETVARIAELQVEENLRRHGIEVLHGTASLRGPHTVNVVLHDGTERALEARTILLATGSRPAHPPLMPDDPDVHDSESLLSVHHLFASIMVIGGGSVGCEYASILRALGVAVTLVDAAPRLAPMLDTEVSELLAHSFSAMGIDVRLNTGIDMIVRRDGALEVSLPDGATVRCDKVLVAAGRLGNTDGLNLEQAGVQLDARGRVMVDERFQTTCRGIYAAGDVLGPPALASVAAEQGRRAASFALGTHLHEGMQYQPPYGIYSIPEVAMVGLTEEEARRQGIEYEVGRFGFEHSTRATIAGSVDGMVKLLFRKQDRRLLGVHIIGEPAAEMIHLGQAVLHHGGGIDYFIHATFNVPTWSDAYKYAAFDGLQRLEPRRPLRSATAQPG